MNPSTPNESTGPNSADAVVGHLIDALPTSINVAEVGYDRAPLTFAEIVRTGAGFCKIIASLSPENGGRFTEQEMEVIEGILVNIGKPEGLKAMLLARVEAGTEDLNELARLPKAVIDFMQRPYNIRQLLQNVIREVIPPNTPGRKRKIQDEDRPKLLARAEQLRPALVALGQLLQVSRKCSLADGIQFLRKEYPEACDYLLRHIKRFEILTKDDRLTARARTLEAEMRIVADAIAGVEHDITARYSVKIVEEERRAARRRSKRAVSHKM